MYRQLLFICSFLFVVEFVVAKLLQRFTSLRWAGGGGVLVSHLWSWLAWSLVTAIWTVRSGVNVLVFGLGLCLLMQCVCLLIDVAIYSLRKMFGLKAASGSHDRSRSSTNALHPESEP